MTGTMGVDRPLLSSIDTAIIKIHSKQMVIEYEKTKEKNSTQCKNLNPWEGTKAWIIVLTDTNIHTFKQLFSRVF